jgi:two-component system, NarL family, invasion response regulator UvrY
MKNFLVIDDHEIVREGVKNLLLSLYNPCTVYEAGDAKAVLQKLKSQAFDLVLMDVQMPGTDTIGLLEYIHNTYPGIKVLIFSMSAEYIYAKKFLKAGARGFISKSAELTELKKAIELVLNNRHYISEELRQIFADQLWTNEPANPFEKLSKREFFIATMLIKGNSVSEISALLNSAKSTVGTHKLRLFEKLEIKNIVELIELGREYNIS